MAGEEGKVMSSSTIRRYGSAVGLVAAGVVAGGVLASSMSASAADGTPTPTPSTRPANPNPGDPSKPQRSDETLLTGDTLAKVKAAVLKKYPGATFVRVETDSDGAYEAHIRKADGTPATIEVDKAFTVTGEEKRAGRHGDCPGGPGGPGGGRTGEGRGGPPPQDSALRG